MITDRLRGRRRKVGGRRAEVDLEDAYEDYRAPQIQDIPGRIQGLPHDNSKLATLRLCLLTKIFVN